MDPTTTSDTITAKICTRCLQRKSLDEFNFMPSTGTLKSYCASCDEELDRLWKKRIQKRRSRRRKKTTHNKKGKSK